MGCKGSTEKPAAPQRAFDDEDAKAFLEFVHEAKHPVAVDIMKEWETFLNLQLRADGRYAVHHSVGDGAGGHAEDAEVWSNTENNRVTHQSVDEIGQAFLHYLRYDLCRREWGGNFNYSVAGVTTQGFILITTTVDIGGQHPPPEQSTFKIRLNYFSQLPEQSAVANRQ